MSAKREIESTKVPVEESLDSGYLSNEVLSSAPVSEEIRLTEDLSGPLSSTLSDHHSTTLSDHHSTTLSSLEKSEYDSGVIIAENISGEVSAQITQPEDKVVVELRDHLEKCEITVPEVSPAPIPPQLIPITKVFQQDADGDTVVHITAVHGCKMRTALLIRLCPHPSWLDITNDYGHTALHLAVMSGHAIIARMLVKAGASIAVRDHMGETALHKAVASSKRDCLLALLDPVPNREGVRDAVLNQTNYHGQACVHIAARMGDVEMLQTLVLYGADINVKDGCAGWTPLHMAARAGDEAVSRYLLDRSHVQRYARDYAGRTPLRLSRRTAVRDYYRSRYNHDDDETDTDTEDDGDDFFETHSSISVAVSS